MTVQGEKPFSVVAHSLAISPSAQGYTLQYSADGIGWTSYPDAIPANEVLVINGIPRNLFLKCVGNTDELTITF